MSKKENQIVDPAGCFIFLNSKKLVDPDDEEVYTQI